MINDAELCLYIYIWTMVNKQWLPIIGVEESVWIAGEMAIWKLHLPEVLKRNKRTSHNHQMISDEFFFRIPQHLFCPQHHPAVLLKTAISGRLFVRQAIQAKCTQVPRSFLDFEHLTQEKRQQAEPAMARWHLMAGWLDVMEVKWCKLLLVLVMLWCIFKVEMISDLLCNWDFTSDESDLCRFSSIFHWFAIGQQLFLHQDVSVEIAAECQLCLMSFPVSIFESLDRFFLDFELLFPRT